MFPQQCFLVCPGLNFLLIWIFCKIMDSNSNQRLIWDFRCAYKSILFSCVPFYKQGEFKMLNFQVVCAKKFQAKNDFFSTASKYGMLLLICKKFIKNHTW